MKTTKFTTPAVSSNVPQLTETSYLPWLAWERERRTAVRRDAQIRAGKGKPSKPKPKRELAPVEQLLKPKGQPRFWRWTGSTTDKFTNGEAYTTDSLREAGWKLPKLRQE